MPFPLLFLFCIFRKILVCWSNSFSLSFCRYLRIWFSIGIGFSLAALIGVTVVSFFSALSIPPLFSVTNKMALQCSMILCVLFWCCQIILCEMAKAPLPYAGYTESGDSLFGLSFLVSITSHIPVCCYLLMILQLHLVTGASSTRLTGCILSEIGVPSVCSFQSA